MNPEASGADTIATPFPLAQIEYRCRQCKVKLMSAEDAAAHIAEAGHIVWAILHMARQEAPGYVA